MPYYFFAFSIYSMALAALIQKNVHHRVVIFILGLLPIFFLVICRGNVGTDTAAYLQIVSDIQESGSSDLELGFVLLIKAMLLLGMGPKLILATIACLATGLLVYAASFSRRSLLLAAFCIVPIFYLDMTMNGLRYGLAFTAMMCAVALFYQKRWYLCVVFATAAVLVHLSGWLILAMMAMFADDKDEFNQWAIITVALGTLILVLQNMGEIMFLFGAEWSGVSLKDKASAYMHFRSPSLLSGLAPLTLSFIALGLIKTTDTAAYAVRVRRFYLLLLGIGMAFLIAKFSYAGLRLQFVLLFFMLVCLQFKPAFQPLETMMQGKRSVLIFVVVATLGMATFFKNALTTEGRGPSPWLPYSMDAELLDRIDMDSSDPDR